MQFAVLWIVSIDDACQFSNNYCVYIQGHDSCFCCCFFVLLLVQWTFPLYYHVLFYLFSVVNLITLCYAYSASTASCLFTIVHDSLISINEY